MAVRKAAVAVALLLFISSFALAQASAPSAPLTITVPAGTRVPLVLKNAINTKHAQPGDNVYLQTSFPVTQDNRVVIPAGTYVRGVINRVQRSGRVKGRAEVLMHFNMMIFPNGYTVSLPGTLDKTDSDSADRRSGMLTGNSELIHRPRGT